MSRKKNNSPIGENWVTKSSIKYYRGNAQEVLKMLKQDEETHPLKYVQVDKKTWKSIKE